jgi:hypothetical protein
MYKERNSIRLTVGNIQIDKVRFFRYLHTIVNGNNSLEEEIGERIVQGIKAFYANRTLFKSNLMSRKSKLKLYWSVIRPIVFTALKHESLKKVLYRDC